MNGVLVINKPGGVTSFDVVRLVRRLSRTRRVGHAGTLDPLATGVLPVAVGQATRLVEYLMAGAKVYRATMQLGISTDTQDSEGRVLQERSWQHVDRGILDAVLAGFLGEVRQVPPMFSALKKDGKPLYQLARQGIEVDRQPRTVCIDSLVVDRFAPPEVIVTVGCGKGTYVRTLCHDIGQGLGCGAHLTALERLECGRFTLADSHSPEELQECVERGLPLPLMSPAEALADWPALAVDGASLARLRNGVAPRLADLKDPSPGVGDRVRFLAGGSLVAIARRTSRDDNGKPADFELLKVFSRVDGN